MIFLHAGASGRLAAQSCSVCNLVESISPDSIEATVRALSGEDWVLVDDVMTRIVTRYTFSDQKYTAMKYLLGVAENYGYSPYLQTFILRIVRPDLSGIAVSQNMDTAWAGSVEGKIYISTASDDWNRFELLTTIDGRVNELIIGPGNRLWAACKAVGTGFGKLIFSDNGGVDWETQYDGSMSSIFSLNTITFWDNGFGFSAGNHGSFLNTADGGDSWWKAADASEFLYRNINGSSATGMTHFWVVTDGGYLYESVDFGNTWTPSQLTTARLTDIDFHDQMRGVIVGEKVVFYTTDGGAGWTAGSIDINLRCVDMVDSMRVVAAGGGGDIWVSEDGGATWVGTGTECTGETAVWHIAVTGSGRVWAVGSNEVLRVDFDELVPPDCRIYVLADTLFGKNIIFRNEGSSDPDHRIILCGHYDSINQSTDPFFCAPGADDNATGVACVLECARLLAGVWTEKTIEFVLFDGEELGLIGSSWFVGNLDPDVVYDGVINIDMVGNDYGGGSTIDIAGYEESVDTVLVHALLGSSEDFSLLYPLEWSFRNAVNQPISDNLSFKGIDDIPSVLLIESGYRDNPHYHNCTDLVEFVDFAYVSDVARTVLGAVAGLAGFRGIEAPERVVLHQNFPNPFFSSTRIEFELHEMSRVELSVYDVSGKRVARLIDDNIRPDKYVYLWDGRNNAGHALASGLYFVRLKAAGSILVRKTVIIR